MPFAFPPPPAEATKIRAEVERIKSALKFNDKLRDHVAETLPRFSVTDQADIDTARATLDTFIADMINPEIQNVILEPVKTPTHKYYNIPSPRKRKPAIEHYNGLSLCDESQFEHESEQICEGIYTDEDARKVKAVAIRNLLKYAFWIKVKYLIDPKKSADLGKMF